MKHDDHLIFEALQRKWKLTSMKPAEAADKFGPEHVKVTDKGLRNGQDMVEVNVPVDDKGYDAQEDAENRLTYNPMDGLAKTAHEIRDILKGAANDEARTEHIIRMAQIVLGDAKDYAPAEYRKMLEGLIILLNRFIVVPMN
jgi:hypothetical protein